MAHEGRVEPKELLAAGRLSASNQLRGSVSPRNRTSRASKLGAWLTLSALSLSGVFACSASVSDGRTHGDGGVAGSAGYSSGGSSSLPNLDASDGPVELPNCATDSYGGDLVPLDLYLLLDRSQSMLEADENGLQRWSAITQALENFVNLQGNSDLNLGLGYFPVRPSKAPPTACGNAASCQPYQAQCILSQCCYSDNSLDCPTPKPDSSCLVEDYRIPTQGIQPITTSGPLILHSMENMVPEGNTPMAPALAGAIHYASTWATANPERMTAVVLASDGSPYGCAASAVSDVADQAAAGLAQDPSVMTFVIGMGQTLSGLNSVANAGGTGEAIIVDIGVNAAQEFLDALNKIRGNFTCSYAMPELKPGETVDPNQLNVSFTKGKDPSQFVPRVDGAAQCGLGEQAGWFYDNPSNPTRITLCKHSCEAVKAGGIRVDVVLGCKTIIK